MSNFINYSQILTDFRNLLAGATLINGLSFQTVLKNAQDSDFVYPNMPMADCCLMQAIPLNMAGNNYYSTITIQVEIACFDMTSRDKCATMRDGLTNAVQYVFQQTPHFSANVDTVQVGPVQFADAESKTQGQFMASAILEFNVKLYSGA